MSQQSPIKAVVGCVAVTFLLLVLFGPNLFSSPLHGGWTNVPGLRRNTTVSTKTFEDIQDTEVLGEKPRILILTPVKDAANSLDNYFQKLYELDYPHDKISIGFLEGDGKDENSRVKHPERPDGKPMTTWERLQREAPTLKQRFARVTMFQKHYGLKLDRESRHQERHQLQRRRVLALSRNSLLYTALRDEDWVLWVDVDVANWEPSILKKLLAAKKNIVVPNVVMSPGGRSYDLNSWRRGVPPAVAEAEGGGKESESSMVVKTKDLSMGNPGQVLFSTPSGEEWQCRPQWAADDSLQLEGYKKSGNIYLHKLRSEGNVVKLDGVGGAMLLINAQLHREGLNFPPYPYRQRIETEGLAMMARDMGEAVWGMPNLEIVHK